LSSWAWRIALWPPKSFDFDFEEFQDVGPDLFASIFFEDGHPADPISFGIDLEKAARRDWLAIIIKD
jgi:hypothetical protein